MAVFWGCLESTSFRVRDKEKFLADPGVQCIQKHANAEDGFFDVEEDGYVNFGWSGQYPGIIVKEWDDKTQTCPEVNITEVISKHILPGDACQVGISGNERRGNEKLRYIGGSIYYITSKGVAEFPGVTEYSDRLDTEYLVKLMKDFSKAIIETADWRMIQRGKRHLSELSHGEKQWCKFFIRTHGRSFFCHEADGPLRSLIEKGIVITFVQPWGKGMREFRIQPWALKYLQKHPALLK